MAPPHTEPRKWACHKCHHRTRTHTSSNCWRCKHHCCTECRMSWRWGFDSGRMAWYTGDITDRHFHRNKRAVVRNLDLRGPSRCSKYISFIPLHFLIQVGVSVDFSASIVHSLHLPSNLALQSTVLGCFLVARPQKRYSPPRVLSP